MEGYICSRKCRPTSGGMSVIVVPKKIHKNLPISKSSQYFTAVGFCSFRCPKFFWPYFVKLILVDLY